MGLFNKDQTTQIILLGLIFTSILCYFILYRRRSVTVNEGFQTVNSIPADAENPDLKNEQIYGLIPQAASASIYRKKFAQDKVKNIDNLPFNKESGTYVVETVDISLNADPNDIQTLLEQRALKEGFASTVAVNAQLAQEIASDQAQGFVQEQAQKKLAQTKGAQKVGNLAIKSLNKVSTNLSKKLSPHLGEKMAKKLAEKAAKKIAEIVGKKAAIATASGAAQTAIPDPTGITKVFGIILTVIGAAGLVAQVAIANVLKGEEGFCPAGYERLNKAIPSFMTQVPGIGDILDVMGPYVCYRNACEANEDEDAGLCYDKCDKGYKGVGPVCWANSNDVGVGILKECPPGWTNDGLTCREPIKTTLEPCPPGSKDVAGTCWGKERTCVGGCGGDCGRWRCCGCSWSYDRDVVTRSLGSRNMKTTGGTVKGRAAGSDLPCPSSAPNQVDGLCYKNCPADTPNRVAGMPYLCSAAASVGDGRGKTSYGRGVGRPKLKMKAVEKDPTVQPPPPPTSSSSSFAVDPNTTCKADFSSTATLREMCKFYYKSAAAKPETVNNGLKITYISRITRVIASSEQSCDVLCDLTTIVLPNATSKTPLSSTTVQNKNRRFYFAKIAKKCQFIVTASTNIDDTAKELSNPEVEPVAVSFSYNPFL
jgi:hypothetical protein